MGNLFVLTFSSIIGFIAPLALNYHFVLIQNFLRYTSIVYLTLPTLNKWIKNSTWFLLKFYNLQQIPLKDYIWLHYQPKRVYCKSLLHGRTSVYEVCLLSEYSSFRKRIQIIYGTKNLACNNCSKILRPNLPEKLNGKHFEKINIKAVITCNNISLWRMTVC